MTPFAKRCALAALEAELQAMIAANQYRERRGEAQAYPDGHFDNLASRMRALAEEAEEPTKPASPWIPGDPPEPPPSAGDESCGIYRKYRVERLNDPKGKHRDCEYFVLDWTHDPYAIPAARAYASACCDKYPELARDLRRKVMDYVTPEQLKAITDEKAAQAAVFGRAVCEEMDELRAERDSARAEVDELRKDRDAWVAECQSHVREKSELATQLEQARRDVHTKNDAFQCAVAAKDSAHQALRQREKDELAALAELDESRAEVERLKQALHSANTDLERLRAERSHLDRIRELESKVESLLDERAVHIDTIDDLTEERNRLSGRLRTTEEERSHAVILGRQADDYSRHARGEVERLKQELSASRDALPAWVVPLTKEISYSAFPYADRLFTAWRNLTDDQRRQCLGET